MIVTVVGGAITAIDFNAHASAHGTGYTTPPIIIIEPQAWHITGREGTGAIATAIIDGSGVVTSITVDNGGTGYVQGQVLAYIGLYAEAGGQGQVGSAAILQGAVGATGVGTGMVGNVDLSSDGMGGPINGSGGLGSSAADPIQSPGTHGGMWIRSYK